MRSPLGDMSVPQLAAFFDRAHRLLHRMAGCPPGCTCPLKFIILALDDSGQVAYAAEDRDTSQTQQVLRRVAASLLTDKDVDISMYLPRRNPDGPTQG